jgi:hypothetical protein
MRRISFLSSVLSRLKNLPVLFLLHAILLTGCYATKPVKSADPVMTRKKIALVYQDQEIFEVTDISFNGNALRGRYMQVMEAPLSKFRKTSMLEVYLHPDYNMEIDTSQTMPLSIPYASIERIEKTRFRFEYLLILPVFIVLVTTLNVTGSSF